MENSSNSSNSSNDKNGKTPHEHAHSIRQGSVHLVITKHLYNGVPRFSFSLQKEYEKNGETRRSHWFDKRHLSDLRLAIEDAEEWMEKAEDHGRAAKRSSSPPAPSSSSSR